MLYFAHSLTKPRFVTLLMIAVFGFISPSHAQKLYQPAYNTVSFGLGTASYYGDLSPYMRIIPSTFDDIRWNIGASFTHNFGNRWSVRAGLRYIRIAGDDANMLGVKGREFSYARNLHFRNDIKELSLNATLDILKTDHYLRRRFIRPYLVGGVALFLHSPQARPNPAVSSSTWVSLRDLRTEGQGLPGYGTMYKSWAGALTGGVGFKIKLSNYIDLGLEATANYVTTDYIDDVGGNYAKPSDLATIGALSVSMGNRSLERTAAYSGQNRTAGVRAYVVTREPAYSNTTLDPFASTTMQNFGTPNTNRGTSSFLSDGYMITSVSVIYYLGRDRNTRCPKF